MVDVQEAQVDTTLETNRRRPETLLDRHKNIAELYSPGGQLEFWGAGKEEMPQVAEEICNTILSSGILPSSPEEGKKSLLVSLSSNSGSNEKVLSEKLGSSYTVIAGDIVDLKRIPSDALPVRFDASSLPLRPNSVAAMLDITGAIWHEANPHYDSSSQVAKHLLDMFSSLRESLQEEGVIMIDDPEGISYPLSGTAMRVDTALKASGVEIEGFDTSTIGQGVHRLRVYKKVSNSSHPTEPHQIGVD